jgi:hypothetical protein
MTSSLAFQEQESKPWLWVSFKPRYFKRRHKLRSEHDRWRKIAQLQHLARAARGRLEWIIFWDNNRRDVALTARHFGIARKTFYKWQARFEKDFLKGWKKNPGLPVHEEHANIHLANTRMSFICEGFICATGK